MRASLVIAAFNEGDALARTVRSCLDTTDGLDCEVVVADDASTDGSIEALRREFPRARVVAHDGRRGTSPAKDTGARHAEGDVLVFLDGHCKPEPGALARLVDDVEAFGRRAIITPVVAALDVARWENQMHQVGHGYRMDLERLDNAWIGLERLRPAAAAGGRRLYESPAFIGCCLAMARGLYVDLGGFDAGMQTWGIEDIDLGLRAWLRGHPILHDTEPVIGHRFRADFGGDTVPMEHVLANQLRMARTGFSDAVWEDWVARCRARQEGEVWEAAWALFESDRAEVERRRDDLMSRRVHDEFWYAERFGLPWPPPKLSPRFRTMPTLPPPAVASPPPADRAEEDDPRERFLDHYRHPRNRRMLADPDAVGCVRSAGGAVLSLYLKLGRDGDGAARIERAAFQSERCGVAVAYASLLTDLIVGRDVEEALGLGTADLLGQFGERAGAVESAELALAALRRALASRRVGVGP